MKEADRKSLNEKKDLSERDYKLEQVRKESGRGAEEEYGAELTPIYGRRMQPDRASEPQRLEEEAAGERSGWMGYTALILSLLSLFVFPALFGLASVILGTVSFAQGQRALGIWSIAIGLVALAGYFLLVPHYA
ncbi:hypothetical protein LJK88_19605 [Paenibacillus sp. P26]|nr:hypothetical protein LJK88_19605 [Paenibacillus sp. P26]UUZ96117.1 hypothetical protein LJK87_18220 [Paenibacillus sp. P25]